MNALSNDSTFTIDKAKTDKVSVHINKIQWITNSNHWVAIYRIIKKLKI